MIDFEPSEEQQLIVDTVRQFAVNELRPLARACAESRKLPEEVLARAHQLGLVANALPEAWGGGGARSAVTGALVAEELAYGDLALALAHGTSTRVGRRPAKLPSPTRKHSASRSK